ncbi:MAG TPA: amidohydrolase family protein [Candidatus Saccharimonadales bacterium]|nr:amidohydrolase family protein [Candidatus Saccharimonadales bacterium]
MRNGNFNRRGFLAAAVKTVPGMSLMEWDWTARATTSTGPLTVIDAHAHFYDPTRPQGVSWPPRDDKFLYRSRLPSDYRALPVPRPVTGVIVVEASSWLEDNQWVLDLAEKSPFILGFVGNLPIGAKAFAAQLKRFAANKIFRGIRLRDRKLEGMLENPAFVTDLNLLADYGLSLDLAGGMEILPFADRLAEKLPSLRIVIDHLAGVVVDGKSPPPDWSRQMQSLARSRNIYCKLSGLVEGTGRADGLAPRDADFYRPVLDAMRTIFGPDRLIYASNWPVSARFATLATVQRIVGEYFHNYGHAIEAAVFSQSAKRAYWGED